MSKLVLNETITMCSGVCCSIKEECYRYRLNVFFDYPKLKRNHSHPEFLEPRCQNGKCRYFMETQYQEEGGEE